VPWNFWGQQLNNKTHENVNVIFISRAFRPKSMPIADPDIGEKL